MKVTDLRLSGLKLIEPQIFRDDRGFFVERYQQERFQAAGLPTAFFQDNHSRSRPGVIRGLHFQLDPAQGKLVSCVRGTIWDVAVDIRKGSPTYLQWEAVELSDENGRMLWIPAGFAHGFCVLGTEPADVFYKVDQPWNPKTEKGVRFNDPQFAIKWPIPDPILSARDRELPRYSDLIGH